MPRLSRWGAVAAAAALLSLITPPAAQAEPAQAEPPVTGSVVQVQAEFHGVVFMNISDKIHPWTAPLTVSTTCLGTAVDDTHIVTSSRCTDPTSADATRLLRKAAGDWYIRDRELDPALHGDLDQLVENQDGWRIAANAEDTTAPPTATVTVRHVAGTRAQSSEATLVKASTDDGIPLSVFTVTDTIDLTPLAVADDDPDRGDAVVTVDAVKSPFSAAPPTLTATDAKVTSVTRRSFEFPPSVANNATGGPVLDDDGRLVGVITFDTVSPRTTAIRSFLAANGVAGLHTDDDDDDEASTWVWLGPTIGAVVLVAVGGVAVLVVGRRRQERVRREHLAMLPSQSDSSSE